MNMQSIRQLDEWLDAGVSEQYLSHPLGLDWLRTAKVAEKLGEVITDLIAFTGGNPRKHEVIPRSEMLRELAQVAITATVVIQHFTKDVIDTWTIIDDETERLVKRAGLA